MEVYESDCRDIELNRFENENGEEMEEELLVYIGVWGCVLIGWFESMRIVGVDRRFGEELIERWRSLEVKRFLIFGMRFENY